MKRILLCFLTLLILSFSSCAEPLDDNDAQNLIEKSSPTAKIQQVLFHTVRFETNGGTFVSARNTKTLSEAPTTERDGYLFEGWYRDASLTQRVIYPLSVDSDMTVYAKWLCLSAETSCNSTSIKLDTKLENIATYSITPTGFDMNRLEELGYYMRITVTYDVSYSKDYDVLWDIGYMGAPKYEASILNSSLTGSVQENITAPQFPDTREITYTDSVSDIRNDRLKLIFSTDNIQNTIHFYNIRITYECIR